MGSEQLVQVLRGIPQSDIVYEVIVDSLIESLYTGKKLNGNTYTKIKDEVDVLRRSMKKVKDKKVIRLERDRDRWRGERRTIHTGGGTVIFIFSVAQIAK